MMRQGAKVAVVAWGLVASASIAAGPSCTVTGSLRAGPDLSRPGICRAVLEGFGRSGRGLSITIRFEPPATATARLTSDGAPRPPVSIAINDRALGREDLVELGRTIAGLMRDY